MSSDEGIEEEFLMLVLKRSWCKRSRYCRTVF